MNILRMLGFPLGRLMRPFRTVLSVYCDKAIHNSASRPFARPSSLTLGWMRPDCLSDSLTATADCGLAYAQQQDDGRYPRSSPASGAGRGDDRQIRLRDFAGEASEARTRPRR